MTDISSMQLSLVNTLNWVDTTYYLMNRNSLKFHNSSCIIQKKMNRKKKMQWRHYLQNVFWRKQTFTSTYVDYLLWFFLFSDRERLRTMTETLLHSTGSSGPFQEGAHCCSMISVIGWVYIFPFLTGIS